MNITCPNCAKALSAPDEMAGKRGQCPSCGAVLLMPSAPPGPPAADHGLSGLDLAGGAPDLHLADTSQSASHHELADAPPGGGIQVIKVTCPKCGQVLKAPAEMAGKRGQCPGCAAVLLMPSAPRRSLEAYQSLSGLNLVGAHTADPHSAEASHAPSHPVPPAAQPAGSAETMKVTCPNCGKVLKATPSMAGKRGQCPACNVVFLMPATLRQSLEAEPGLSGLDLVGPHIDQLHAELVAKAFVLPESYDGLVQLLASIDPATPIMSIDQWAALRCAAEALLSRGHPEVVAPVMKAWACTAHSPELRINHDAIALLEECGPAGLSPLLEVVEHWIDRCTAGSHRCDKFKGNLLLALETLERYGSAVAPSKSLIVRCLAFEQTDRDFEAEVRAIADRIARTIDLYAPR